MKTIEEAIEKATKYHNEMNEKLSDLDNPYESIARFLPSGLGYDDIFPKEEDETENEWATRIESEIDTIWTNIENDTKKENKYCCPSCGSSDCQEI